MPNEHEPQHDQPTCIILPPFPDDDPELRDYHLQHLTRFYEDFLRITRSRPKTKPKDVARAGQPGTANQPETPKRRRRATKQQVRVRLAVVREWLVEGRDAAAIVHKVREQFGVGRRMAQLYVQRVKKRFADEAAAEDYLAHLQLSRLQHEKMLAKAFGAIELHAADPKLLNALLRTAGQFLKRRDEVLSIIVEHRTAVQRDRSPDQEQEKRKRQGTIEMPIAEWWERLSNIHYTWRLHWEKHHQLKQEEDQLRRAGQEQEIRRNVVEHEIQRQVNEHLKQGSQTVHPELLKELQLDDMDLPPS